MKHYLRNAYVALLGVLIVAGCTTERYEDTKESTTAEEYEELIVQAKEWFTTYRGKANIDKINNRVGKVDWDKVRVEYHSKKAYYGVFAPIQKLDLGDNTRRNVAIHIDDRGINGFIMEYTRTSALDAKFKEGISKIYNKRGIWLKSVEYAGGKRIKTDRRYGNSPLNTARKSDEVWDLGSLDPACVGDCGDDDDNGDDEDEEDDDDWPDYEDDECYGFDCYDDEDDDWDDDDDDDYDDEDDCYDCEYTDRNNDDTACKGCDEDKIEDNTDDPCVGDIIEKLKQKDVKNLVVPSIGGLSGTSHIAQTILDIFDNEPIISLTFKIATIKSPTAEMQINAQTRGVDITLNTNLVKKATQLMIAKTIIHETTHAYINYNEYKYASSPSDMTKSIEALYSKYKKTDPKRAENLSQHQFMSQYVDALARSLSMWDNYNQPMDYYKALSWGGLESSSTYKDLSEREKSVIQNVIRYEVTNSKEAKGSKCD